MPTHVNMKTTIIQIMMNYFMSLNMYLIVLMMGPKDAETLKDTKTLMKPNMMNKLTKNYMFKSF